MNRSAKCVIRALWIGFAVALVLPIPFYPILYSYLHSLGSNTLNTYLGVSMVLLSLWQIIGSICSVIGALMLQDY